MTRVSTSMALEPETERLEGFPSAKRLKLEPVNEPVNEPEAISDKATTSDDIVKQLLDIENGMCKKLEELNFGPPITHIYNPLDYASRTHSYYVRCYGNTVKKILFVGMNPGPFGMAQNGVRVMWCNGIRVKCGIRYVWGKLCNNVWDELCNGRGELYNGIRYDEVYCV